MIQLTPVELLIMEHATEDWYGLYELLFEMQGSPPELQNATDRRAVILVGLRRLLGFGLIEIGVRHYPDGRPVMTSPPEGATLMEADGSWAYPHGTDSVVTFTATPLGVRLFEGNQGTA